MDGIIYQKDLLSLTFYLEIIEKSKIQIIKISYIENYDHSNSHFIFFSNFGILSSQLS